jgi:hypothetical protein
MNIKTEYLDYVRKWIAWDEDSYDGAPDSDTSITGIGQSEEEAIEDLKEFFREEGLHNF